MKKLINVLVIALFALSAKAQMTYVQAGLNLANITKTNDGQTEKNNMLPTFNVGLMHRFGLAPYAAIETGLLFTGKGSKAETYFNGGNDNYIKTKFNPLYLEVPLNFVLKMPMDKSSGFFLNAGPYATVGIAGKAKSESKILTITSTSEKNIKFSNDDPFTSEQDDAGYDKLKRFDFGLNFGGGFEFKHLILKANYGMGLTKINSTQGDNDTDDKNKFRTVSFSVGIPLGRK
ncbi:MAG: porin family protein [Ferruginibacter sp.]